MYAQKTRFFKYFRVNLFAECPFWVVTQLCGNEGCGVCECDDNEIPLPWRLEDSSDKVDLSPPPPGFTRWKDKKEDMWVIPYGSDSGPLEDMCFEERVFYKLISGLHASITTHITYYYEKDRFGQWKHNPALFKKRFEGHQDRIENLYFTFLAVGKIGGFLGDYQFHTGNEIQDQQTYLLVQELLKKQVMCSPSFDETLLFRDTYDKESLISQFKGHFQNISSILNCVTCEKCKLYGKMQTLGLGTALKILFEEDQSSLQRNEIIALVNTLRQLSNSISSINEDSRWKDDIKAASHIKQLARQGLHWQKGLPFANPANQGKYSRLTLWEQIDEGQQYTPTRKFFTLVPIIL
eukprot:gene4241-4948_t